MSDPPGTKWLKGQKRQKAPTLQLADVPTKGSTQYGISPFSMLPDNWHLQHSPPDTDQWEWHPDGGTGVPLSDALKWLQLKRSGGT